MDPEFWAKKWEKNEIGFHQPEGNRLFAKHFDKLRLDKGARLFVPLCGKTRDIGRLLSEGHPVAGVELVELAVRQLFDELQVTPTVSRHGKLKLYRAEGLDIFVGDLFDVTRDALGPVDAVYDRAAYVALP